MDIQLKKTSSKKRLYIAAPFAIALLSVGYFLQSDTIPSIKEDKVTLVKVEQGSVDLYSQAFGELFSAQERILTSQAAGKVSAILLRPGATVTPESVILTLTNPELNQAYQSALGALNAQKAQLESFELEQQNARLDFQGRIADIESALESAQLDLDVNTQLSERGVSARLEILRAELEVKLQKKKLEFEKQKYEHFTKVQAFQLKQQHIEVEQQNQQVALLRAQLDDLDVKAGIVGTLQNLDVEIGESLPQGATLGRVGSVDALLARLRVPQHQADQIAIGASVELTTRKGSIKGEISRIESVVNNGVVLAEVQLIGELPSDARPLASVTGQIFIHTQENALYVRQTAGLRPQSQIERFVLDETQSHHAQKRQIQLGELTKGKLIIQSGLQVNDYFISQMQDTWAMHNMINIEQKG